MACGKSRNRAVTDVVGTGDVHQRFAFVSSRPCFFLLVRRELEFPPELHASRFCSRPAFAGARAYQVALELRKPGQNGKHQSPVRGRGVGPTIPEGAETGFLLGDEGQRIEQVAGNS